MLNFINFWHFWKAWKAIIKKEGKKENLLKLKICKSFIVCFLTAKIKV